MVDTFGQMKEQFIVSYEINIQKIGPQKCS